MDSLWALSLDGLGYEAIINFAQTIFFHLSKCLACNAEKNITLEDNKKRVNTTNFINIHIQTYIPILYVTIMTQNKNDSINSCY